MFYSDRQNRDQNVNNLLTQSTFKLKHRSASSEKRPAHDATRYQCACVQRPRARHSGWISNENKDGGQKQSKFHDSRDQNVTIAVRLPAAERLLGTK